MTASPAAPGTAPGGGAQDTATPGHECSFPIQPPHGLLAPGPCLTCGKPYALAQAERLIAENDIVAARFHQAEAEAARYKAERDKAQRVNGTLGTVCSCMAETIMAAWIDAKRGDHDSSMEWLLQHIENVPEYEPWDGAETGMQWLERTGATDVYPRTYRDALADLTVERDDYRKLLDQAYERLATVSGIVFGAGDDEAARCHLRDYLTIRDDTHEEDEDTDA